MGKEHGKSFMVVNLENEIWVPCFGSKKHEISNLGRVKAKGDYRYKKISNSVHYYNERLINPVDKKGYKYISLTDTETKKQKHFSVHRLVLLSFMPIPKYPMNIANHLNSLPSDNSLENLEWVSTRENVSHSNSKRKNKSSRFTGVSWFKALNKWEACISIKGKKRRIGFFFNEIEAHNAYKNTLETEGLSNRYLISK